MREAERLARLVRFIAGLGKKGITINLRELKDRLRLQKYVYLAQHFGINLRYDDFTLYLKGPYSKKLADDYYKIKEVSEE